MAISIPLRYILIDDKSNATEVTIMAEKEKEVQSSQLNLAVVALVALVAIVGLVALVMNAARIPSLATGGQMVQAKQTIAATEPAKNIGGNAYALYSYGGSTYVYDTKSGKVVSKVTDSDYNAGMGT